MATTPRIVAFGDNDVDCYEARGTMYPGGNALNAAVFARRSGADAVYIGAMSDDAAGRHMRAALRHEDVDITRLRRVEGRTAFCVIGHNNGEREFLRADPGVSIIAPNPADLACIAHADAVHTGRSSHLETHLPDFASRTKLSYDFANHAQPDYIARFAPMCYLASFSGGDLTSNEIVTLRQHARTAGAQWCLVTRGGDGAILSGPDIHVSVAPVPVDVVDTLGAGDSFIARVLTGLLRNEDPTALMQAAAIMAAQTCGQHGGFGHPAPIDIDESHALSIWEFHARAAEEAARATQNQTSMEEKT
ncbi:PfkB family carbohydrate kinase [Yoonia sp. MH D7]